jgi:hypothetical protein
LLLSACRSAEENVRHARVEPWGYLGLRVGDVPFRLRAYVPTDEGAHGVVVTTVVEGGPGERAGVSPDALDPSCRGC